ncbi:MAG: radical SAM protein [Sulfolobus sp.]
MNIALVRIPKDFWPFIAEINDYYISQLISYIMQKFKKYSLKVDIYDYILNPELDIEKLIDNTYDMILVIKHYPHPLSLTRRFSVNIKLHNKETLIGLWGMGIGANYEEPLIDRYADFIVVGDEASVADLIYNIYYYNDFTRTKGIAYRNNNNKIIINYPILKIQNLDQLPLPYLYHIMEDAYKYSKYSISDAAEIMTSRGCYANCSFCHVSYSKSIDNSYKWYQMSPKKVVNIIYEFNKKFGIKIFRMKDLDFFGPNPKRVIDIANGIIENNLDVTIYAYTRAENIIKIKDKLKLLNRAGIKYILLGIETFSDKKLKLLNKGTNSKINIESINELIINNFCVDISLIPYSAFDTLEDIRTDLITLKNLLLSLPMLKRAQIKSLPMSLGNVFEYYGDFNKLKMHNFNKVLTIDNEILQSYLALLRLVSDPNYGPIPWFKDEKVPIVGLLAYILSSIIVTKTIEVYSYMKRFKNKDEIKDILKWELQINEFAVDLLLKILDIIYKIEKINLYNFNELIKIILDQFQIFNSKLPKNLQKIELPSHLKWLQIIINSDITDH